MKLVPGCSVARSIGARGAVCEMGLGSICHGHIEEWGGWWFFWNLRRSQRKIEGSPVFGSAEKPAKNRGQRGSIFTPNESFWVAETVGRKSVA